MIRRLRGAILRLAFHRRSALLAGAILVATAAALGAFDYEWESWVTDGSALVAGATGAALIVIGWSGRQSDWIDPDPTDPACGA